MSHAPELVGGEGILHVFRRLADQAPDHPFLSVDGQDLTRVQFLDRVSLWAGALHRQGVGERDYVLLVAPNGIDWCVAFWAAVSLGARPVPLDPQVGAWELQNLLSLMDVRLCLVVSRHRTAEIAACLLEMSARLARPPVLVCLDREVPGMIGRDDFLQRAPALPVPSRSVSPDDWLMLACTSGTTGNPKIIVVPHAGFLRAQLDMAALLALSPNDRMLLGMPLYHQGGLGMGLQALLAGATAIYQSAFEPQRFLETMESRRVTVAQLSATLAKLLLSCPGIDRVDLGSLRLSYFAGEVLPDDLAKQFWHERRIRVINIIGSSETATMVMWDSDRDAPRSASEFCSLPFTSIHVGGLGETARDRAEPGSLWVSTDALLLGYHGNPSETERRLVVRDGVRWFDTADLVLALPDGYVRFVGRLKRAIKRGPNLVHPEEVESFLLSHPAVAAVAVTREDHELFGDSIVAWVQPAPAATLSRAELLAFCRGNIAAYKIPDRFQVVEHIPVDIGKVQYRRIRSEQTRP
jgi:acyl-CoA synthetase (AMP-forming)/AMP-acid ligase II